MMAAALKALTVMEARFFGDERTFLTGDEFTAAGTPAPPPSARLMLLACLQCAWYSSRAD